MNMDRSTHTLLKDAQTHTRSSLSHPWEWWYHLTAPKEPEPSASFQKREAARRGRLASTTLFWMTIFTLLPLPVALISRNIPFLVLLVFTLCINVLALALNRLGYRTLAGVISVIVLGAGIALSLVMNPGGLDVSNLPTFDLLIESTLVAVAFFPSWSVFVVILLNCLFIIIDLSLEHHSIALGYLLSTATYDVLVRPIILQSFVAVIVYLWVRSATQAIARADRAEEISKLERREIERQEQELQQKQQLDIGMQIILQTHVQVANGNFQARAPLNRENVLWQIAYSLNTLISRLQRYNQIEAEQQHLSRELAHLLEAVQTAKQQQRPLLPWRTRILVLDQLIGELSSSPFGELSTKKKREV